MSSRDTYNKYFFGLGTIGRDMFYAMVSMYFVWFLTEVMNLDDRMLAWTGGILTVLRVFDALNDPLMGVIVDNTVSRWGKFKPWLISGALMGVLFFLLLFADLGLTGPTFLIVFAICYLGWDLTYGLNDIAYWSMLPALSLNQKKREKIGAFARICANIGLFSVVVGILPATNALGFAVGSLRQGWFIFAVIIAILMVGFQLFTVFFVKEYRSEFRQEEKTSVRDMVRAIFGNDQLLFMVISMALFMIGYTTTTSFGTYFFKYAFGNENMYPVFAAILGLTQFSALGVFPLFSKRFTRKQLYFGSTIFVLAGYTLFFISPMNIIPIGVSSVLLFAGQAFIQLLMLMFLADTIEYGQWKSGKRNQAVTLSVQPLINKIGGAVATGIVTATLIVSGINRAATPMDVTSQGLLVMKIAMLLIPLLCIVAGYIVYRFKYKIDKQFYDRIVDDLVQRGDIVGIRETRDGTES
ncbi:glycoside-pentoside-hexuronide (GPH):cation symporter [Parasphaerochaeta coccoides]|uniref:Sugar (Glycoside-Pentoside-Hexuronide) transporter n=1 Tax=Parasphaerochaeta coccoides (strain ATCC BAA-1237 / DSM 17374 / SPN1) TaxID=760011 RepID=F4GH97_PARC1|nr:glycoside-pentoside-hexuronide (GPH):cation symporter [Parasphaerochaeta coccoides]AEC01996.1 sugar (Glycoside-Pentoside-Hexuronide) transporter [Parasphaerochaeta coccoides DSM 17374]